MYVEYTIPNKAPSILQLSLKALAFLLVLLLNFSAWVFLFNSLPATFMIAILAIISVLLWVYLYPFTCKLLTKFIGR